MGGRRGREEANGAVHDYVTSYRLQLIRFSNAEQNPK